MAFILRKPGRPGQFQSPKMSTVKGALQRGDNLTRAFDLVRATKLKPNQNLIWCWCGREDSNLHGFLR
jgi:hypothetical protein